MGSGRSRNRSGALVGGHRLDELRRRSALVHVRHDVATHVSDLGLVEHLYREVERQRVHDACGRFRFRRDSASAISAARN